MAMRVKACPFCGSSDHQVEKSSELGCHVVRCLNCDAYGPDGVDAEQAVAWWNVRARNTEDAKERARAAFVMLRTEEKSLRGLIKELRDDAGNRLKAIDKAIKQHEARRRETRAKGK